MTIKKEMQTKNEFVKWFSELNKKSGNIAGGKGANLAEIYNLKIPVPPGFVVTAQAYDYFIKKAGLKQKISQLLKTIDYENTKQLEQTTKQIRELIQNSQFPKEIEQEIIENYENLDTDHFESAKGSALDILKTSSEPVFVAVRSSATTEDLAEASFAGQQDTYLNIKGNTQLIKAIKNCFASLFTARATYYRNKQGFKHEQASLAVVVQKMVNSDKSGVIFSKDPSGLNKDVTMEAVWGLGEGIVSGQITPDKYIVSEKLEIKDKKISNKKIALTRDSSGKKLIVKLKEEKAKTRVLKNHEIEKLAEFAIKLEKHYKKPQDIEFAIENEDIYIVQTRPITTISKKVQTKGEIKGETILTGIPASPGIASGRIRIVEKMQDLQKIKQGDILVTKMTNPDMVITMQKSAAIVTDEGGMTSHAAIVSREMGIPCIVGSQEATTKLKEGETITIDGTNGKVYKGKVAETQQKQVLPVTTQPKTKIKVIVDLPSFAERAAKSKLREVGLTRIEGIIAESGKHPQYFLEQNKINEYEELIFKGIEKISEYFDSIWVRTSDIRTDEFQNLKGAPKEIEANPMLGNHGIRYSLKNPEILKAELKALKKVADKGKKIGMLLPQLISIEELKQVKKHLQEIKAFNLQVGIMVETPAAVQIIRELCEEGIDFISFGTNDLTQYMLAVDRGNKDVQNIYNEMHPAILYQLAYVIRVCKRNKVQTSICGQAGSRKKMVKFLIEKGIDSISVNADAAKEIAEYITKLEDELEYQKRRNQDDGIESTSQEFARKINNASEQSERVSGLGGREDECKLKTTIEQPQEPNTIKIKIEQTQENNLPTQEQKNFIQETEQTPENIRERVEENIKATNQAIKTTTENLSENKEQDFYDESFQSPDPEESIGFLPPQIEFTESPPRIGGVENLEDKEKQDFIKQNQKEKKLDIY